MTVLGTTQATQTRLARRRLSMSTPQVPVVVSLAQITDLFYFIELVILSERTNVLQSALLLDVMYRCATDRGDGPDGGRGRQGLESALDPHSRGRATGILHEADAVPPAGGRCLVPPAGARCLVNYAASRRIIPAPSQNTALKTLLVPEVLPDAFG